MISIDEKDTKYPIRYTFKNGINTYKGKYRVCENPICTCCNIELVFDNHNNQIIYPELEIELNVEKRLISDDKKGNKNYKFSQILINDFYDQDWKILTKLFLEKKTLYTEHADLISLDVVFPIDEIEMESNLISYNGVLPFAKHIYFDINDISLIVEDLYCVQPYCNCHDVHLFFSSYTEDKMLFPFLEENLEDIYLIYNLKRKKWSLEEHEGIAIEPKRIMSAFSDAYDIQKLYSHRYGTIRNLYKHFRRQFVKPIVTDQNIVIERNDPCPCGSGKKYKKCCMNSGI